MTPLPTNHQEIFDAVARGLAAQGRKSYDYRGCVYRAENGCKCAVGQLIPDDRYDPRFDDKGAGGGIRRVLDNVILGELLSEWKGNYKVVNLLASLQSAHDGARSHGVGDGTFTRVWEYNGIARCLKNVASSYGLDDSVVFACWPREETV